jgi:hypothetical protein
MWFLALITLACACVAEAVATPAVLDMLMSKSSLAAQLQISAVCMQLCDFPLFGG